MAIGSKSRFAVGAVTTLENARAVIADLEAAAVKADLVTLIGPARKLFETVDDVAAATGASAQTAPDTIETRELCIAGRSDRRERERAALPPLSRLVENAATRDALRTALSEWMPAGLAAQLDRSLRKGRILLWIPLLSPEDEITTCHALFHYGCDAVQTHDLARLPSKGRLERRDGRSGWSARC